MSVRAIGLMSGTSLDGIDAARVALRPRGDGYDVNVENFITVPFEDPLRERILAALPPSAPTVEEVCALDAVLGDAFASAAREAAAGLAIDYVATHGLTAFHRGEASLTLQIGSPYAIRDAARASVVFDFRRADCAAGGNGAPLVPYVDGLLFAAPGEDVVALNLGGIANVTVLRGDRSPSAAIAFDTGPANMLLDAFVRDRTGGRERCDRDGAYALRGEPARAIVSELARRNAAYLDAPPPKSTGRERFGAHALHAHADLLAPLSLHDGCATLVAFTVATIGDALGAHAPAGARVIASGGGARNPALVAALARRIAERGGSLVLSDALGLDADAKEAVAFAVLGYETLRGRPANLPSATGARRPAILGAIAPYDLAALLDKIARDAATNDAA